MPITEVYGSNIGFTGGKKKVNDKKKSVSVIPNRVPMHYPENI